MQFIQDNAIAIILTCSLLVMLFTLLLASGYWRMQLSRVEQSLQLVKQDLIRSEAKVTDLNQALNTSQEQWTSSRLSLTQVQAEKSQLEEKLSSQKKELTDLHGQLYDKFEVMANQILERKTEKFTQVNEQQIKNLIEPLGKDIEAFKLKVTEESKQRFSLGEKVVELVQLNSHMLQTTENLTKALKGESKTQGRWGEMILETILEKSGLRSNEQYFMEHQLYDKSGKALRSESEGKKMRPDALIKYPDDRSVIIDSKVSLTAYARAVEADADVMRDLALAEHLLSIKNHIKALSIKAYDDYDRSLDFVLMFVPSEPAYIAAMQTDPELWNYAYDKRILLQSPTNLITSLKLIEELWKREAHNQNAQAIAERGAKLYDKFVGFVEKLEDVGLHIEKAKDKYDEGFKQLSSGRGNLIRQAEQLKGMVGKTKKELNVEMEMK